MEFTPFPALVGGLMIGAAAVTLGAVTGRVMGASGIARGALLKASNADSTWQWTFITGVASGGVLNYIFNREAAFPAALEYSQTVYSLAGLLVGFGTSLGSGCTSGHGICGLARASARSLAAVCTFMASGALTTFVFQHLVLGRPVLWEVAPLTWPASAEAAAIPLVGAAASLGLLLVTSAIAARAGGGQSCEGGPPLPVVWACGLTFGLGLGVAGMTSQAKVLGFLDVAGGWDPSLMAVMGGGLLCTLPAHHLWIQGLDRPLACSAFHYPPPGRPIDRDLVLGAALFGMGWGLGGICPGPLITSLLPQVYGREALFMRWPVFALWFLLGSALHVWNAAREKAKQK